MDKLISGQNNVRDNYFQVVDRIKKNARTTGRTLEDIRLVVVTKTHTIEKIQTIIDIGATELGENYIEEAIPKIQVLAKNPEIKWHMIGHVQSRKAYSVCEYFHYMHSLDSVKLGVRLNRIAFEMNKSLPIWMEINVGGEVSKSGWNICDEANWGIILPDIEILLAQPQLNILGLMTVPPFSNDPEASRPFYRRLRKFQEYIINHFQLTGFEELSMGMSADFEVAIQEGSTCVRIGQAILGPRTS